ncbi:SPOR domain-containing protein [Acidovorax sp. JHL-3]|uniref:SPOR domain-containing protein n=1 Tax=Acidovorax sp. JHL-3 TaxID=1276755 RepID=UPI000463EF55|nr:SPOR domain-containing protein [Acidovorax sp. JHL-3]
MHATTESAEITAQLPSKPRSDSALTALYSAALGPVHLSRYLPIFARFDEAGRTTTSWNWAASLCTLNWMVFRQLWGAALVYVAAAEGVALLVFGVGRPLLEWPEAVEWGVAAAFVLLSCAVPGLYGNALLHADTHKKIARALTATHTLNEACALLARQASSWKRLAWLVAGNLALALAAAGAYLAMPSTGTAGADSATPVAPIRPVPLTPSEPPAPPPPLPHPATISALPVASEPAALPSPAATDSAAPTQLPASETMPTPVPAAASEQAPAPAPAAQPQPASSTPPAAAPLAQAADKATPPKRLSPPQAKARASAPDAPAAPPDTTASASTAQPLPAVGTAPGYYINVGLFAEEANARKAQARLLNEGLPAFRQETRVGKKRRLRVRVGPYSDRADADAAAITIRAMGLDALVARQGA